MVLQCCDFGSPQPEHARRFHSILEKGNHEGVMPVILYTPQCRMSRERQRMQLMRLFIASFWCTEYLNMEMFVGEFWTKRLSLAICGSHLCTSQCCSELGAGNERNSWSRLLDAFFGAQNIN
jgi:hypothetical protein